ncbi:hypothetical protein VD659_15850 [Herbiconiux sp. 11R-BC]|uniref:hypothetical protein n=1 Tax=Herbiconiux sp. 11R-BC TaxID=3111637 RepID=UPI003C093906
MEWWNSFVSWLSSTDGRFVVSGIVVPLVAIIVAGLVAAWIASGSIKRLLAKHDRELKIAAIASLIDAAEQASVWNSLTPQEQILSDRATGQSDIQVRLLPIKGADVAANWAAHALAEMKRNSATFGYQVEPAVFEFRDRLIEWQQRPGRAKRVFEADLARWSAEDASSERELLAQQDAWVAQQHHAQYAAPATPPVPEQQPAPAYASTAVLTPAAPLPPTHEPRPTVQQVASGTGTRGVAPGASPIGELEYTTDPGEARAAGEMPPPVNAFPPRSSGTE